MKEEEDKLDLLASAAHWLLTKEKFLQNINKKRPFKVLTIAEKKPPKIPRLVLSLSNQKGLKQQFVLGHNNNNKHKNKEETKKKRTPVFRREHLIEAPPEPEPIPEPRIDRLAELRERVRAAGGDDLQLAVEKPLTATDVSHKHGRLSMPNKYLRSTFLSQQETSQMEGGEVLRVLVVDERSREFCLRLRRWSMGSSAVINLYGDWNLVAAQNSLSADEVIQLWSFRRGSSLCFALVKGQI